MSLQGLIRRFIVHEGNVPAPTITSYLQQLREILGAMQPRTLTERRRLEIAAEHLKKINIHARRLEERVHILEEQVRTLEEERQ